MKPHLTIDGLVGQVLVHQEHGKPLRPHDKAPSTTLRFVQSVHEARLGEYRMTLSIGWLAPWLRMGGFMKGKIVETRGWEPNMSVQLIKVLQHGGVWETHWDDRYHMPLWQEGQTFLEQLNRSLSPEYMALNKSHVYRFDATLVTALETYLNAYLNRPDIVARAASFKALSDECA